MPSRADRSRSAREVNASAPSASAPASSPTRASARQWVERALRAVAVGALLLAWWLTGRPSVPREQAASTALAAGDARALADAVADPRRTTLAIALTSVPDAESRAVLHAARSADLAVRWQPAVASAPLPVLAISTAALADPDGGTRVRVTARDSAPLVLSDSLGWLDSTVVQGGGVQWPVSGAPRALHVRQQGTAASASAAAPLRLGRVRLFASPGWESRFAMDALEEAGWDVDAEFTIAPQVAVTAGAPSALDTARYAAVIALDSVAWRSAAAIARFVRDGGGLLLFPDAAAGTAMASLRVGSLATLLPGIPGGLRTETPRNGLPLRPLTALDRGAVVLERSARPDAPVSVAAARIGAGRVVQAGWTSTWEWRMLGGDDAMAAHREWWRTLLQRAAYAPALPREERWSPLPGDAAPLADLAVRLGSSARTSEGESSAVPGASEQSAGLPSPPPAWLFVVATLALLGEWWSRRLRGAR